MNNVIYTNHTEDDFYKLTVSEQSKELIKHCNPLRGSVVIIDCRCDVLSLQIKSWVFYMYNIRKLFGIDYSVSRGADVGNVQNYMYSYGKTKASTPRDKIVKLVYRYLTTAINHYNGHEKYDVQQYNSQEHCGVDVAEEIIGVMKAAFS